MGPKAIQPLTLKINVQRLVDTSGAGVYSSSHNFGEKMQQKWALITGPTSGIGRAVALQLAKKGFHLLCVARRSDRLEALAKEVQAMGVSAESVVQDITDFAGLEKKLKSHEGILEKLDVLVNNSGLALGVDKLQEGSFRDWDKMIDVNLKALLHTSRLVLPYMVKKNRGHIVNLGSVAGRWVYPGGAVYCATKHAVRAISEGLRMDLLGKNIRVTNIEPGMVETEFSLVRFDGDENKAKNVYKGFKPLSAEDIAETVVWAIDRPEHVNIQELVIFPTNQASISQVHRENG